jgi:hypothetical protein
LDFLADTENGMSLGFCESNSITSNIWLALLHCKQKSS